ncbi:MAG: M15 family metallopeptidase [Woeseiaceae bacterium]|jgi:D-alanyl-D-alanine carboxypeptidase|nr:M15 family metallopeptidase [Woeseiaceae bacterium]
MLRELHDELGIPADYGVNVGLPRFEEAVRLVDAGPNLIGRKVELDPDAHAAWLAMADAAAADGVTLLLVSGFRSWEYQARLIRKKLNAGQSIEEILTVNAAPGFSEHHTGRAIDIASPGSRPLTEEFESSDGFRWLTRNAARFGFRMSYPRDNALGIIYEPWHWTWHPA